jgi:LacI family transcriptional regulator
LVKSNSQTPTLNDVAALSGFSTATVSRCLNFPKQVSDATRDKVLAAVTELGYSPNFAARAMAAKQTKTIGAIIPTMENAIFARGLQAFQEELVANGYTLLVASSSYEADLEEQQVRSLVARGADALLLIGHDRNSAVYEFLEAQGVPSIVTWAYDPNTTKPSVGFDNRASMKAMADEVIRQGHKHLALITAKIATNDRARARLSGIHDAMRHAGLDPDDLIVSETVYSIENGMHEFKKLMDRTNRPTAVLCGNDVLAVGALQSARQLGLTVPDDVSITGFDDIELGQVAYPALTTVHVPHRQMGQAAAKQLIAHVQNDAPLESFQLLTDVRLRGSLGPLPKSEG